MCHVLAVYYQRFSWTGKTANSTTGALKGSYELRKDLIKPKLDPQQDTRHCWVLSVVIVIVITRNWTLPFALSCGEQLTLGTRV